MSDTSFVHSSSPAFHFPVRTETDLRRERRLGIEIEYTGVGLAETAQIVQSVFGGTIKSHHRFSFSVENTPYGNFSIDSDASFVTKRKWEKYFRLIGIDPTQDGIGRSMNETVEDIVAHVSEELVPFEIATPPLPLSVASKIEEVRSQLQARGALGTHAHFFTAYGLQFNPEMPDLRLETMLGYMRAFLLSYDALLATEDIPLARRVLPFIDPFPVEYLELVLDPNYAPSLNGFMRDYLEHNPTRNRALDWLPLFGHINKELLFEYPVEKELVKPRPTLHYRLPSSLIDDPTWTIALEWNKWVEIDDLAVDPERLREFSLAWFAMHSRPSSPRPFLEFT